MLSEVYLMCSLPSLSFGQSPPITFEEFNDMARSQLSAKQYRMLEQMSMQEMGEEGRKPRLKSVKDMLEGLKKDLMEIREARAVRRQPKPEQLPESVLEKNPLDRELQILLWQWEKLDAMVVGKNFTLADVIVYKMKLQLLFRIQSFKPERGEAVMASVFKPSKKKEE